MAAGDTPSSLSDAGSRWVDASPVSALLGFTQPPSAPPSSHSTVLLHLGPTLPDVLFASSPAVRLGSQPGRMHHPSPTVSHSMFVPLTKTWVPPCPGVSFGSGVPSTVAFPSGLLGDPTWTVGPTLLLGLPPVNPTLWTINIKTFVTTVLERVDDFLSRKPQCLSFLVMHQLRGFIDGTINQLASHIFPFSKTPQPNPAFASWIRLDQLIRALLFATVSKDHLTEV